MQPPPRKGNYAKFLKNVHTEQAAKLQAKNQHECDLLEDIRNFTLKKSAIEKSYSEALLKISSAYLNKKIPNIPDLKIDGAEEKWNMWNVWRTVLEENEKLARARLAAVEVFQQQIADDAKVLRMHKMQISKKAIDQLMIVQKELQMCVQDVDKTKKLYFDEEHSAHDVRDKAKDIEEKLKKKKGSFFQSITSLQKNSAKVTSKRDALDEKSTGARNDYLLSLAAANAHQNRYFAIDLQNTMQYLEQGVYDKVQEYLTLMGRTELLTCMATQNSFTTIRDQAQQLTREYNIQCCNLYYPMLKQHIQYEFEPCDNDQIDRVTADHSAATTLGKEARRWSQRIAREVATIRESNRKLQALQQLKESGHKSDPNDPNGPDLDTKIDELKHTARRAETAKMKAEARIECLRAGGVNVDEFLQEAETLSVQDMPRSASSLSVRTDASGAAEHPSSDSFYDSDNDAGSDLTTVERPGSGRHMSEHHEDDQRNERERHDSAEVDALLEQEKQRIEQMAADWDDPTSIDWGTDDKDDTEIPVSSEAITTGQQPQLYKCTALYSYTAQNPDELSIVESEQLEVVGEGDGDGWLRARNYRGEEGFVPQNYLDVERETATATGLVSHGPGLVTQISFSSVDYTIDDHDAVDPESGDEKPPLINGEAPDGFAISLPKTQKDQYGMQFNGPQAEPPGIIVVQVSDESGEQEGDEIDREIAPKTKKDMKSEGQDDDIGLGVAQIVITAATPMEEVEHPFPGVGEDAPEDVAEPTEEPESTESEMETKVEMKSEEEITKETTDDNTEEVEEKSTADDLPADSAPFPVSSSSGSDGDSTSGPSTADNSQSLPSRRTVIEMQNDVETSDEQPDIIPEKMLVGGRASIPDELQPDQLEKLQNLKESNA
ncbi:protein nervous wreck isoform X4 [Diachasma alloeum]|uniref:protein nervous wreck isoform X4 n=1 Tax=Diachasma alloeum TaxID=454923 RepID=UPI0007383A40|nr:protein nervous wreck isoform X4 [Diachasma alloeum]